MSSSKSSFFYTVVCGPRLNLPHQAFARQKSTASGRVDGTWVEPHKYLHLLTMKHSSVNVTLANPKVRECAVDWSRLTYPALMEDLFQAPIPVVNTSETQSHRGSKLQTCNSHRSPDLSFRYSLNKNRLSRHSFQTLGQ